MNTPHDPDQQFHQNLQALGRDLSIPETASSELRSRCLSEFASAPAQRFAMLRKPALLSTLGLAACLVVAFGLLFPTSGNHTVQAATILEKFDEQIAKPKLLEITMDSIVIDELSIDGHLQVAPKGVAGDLHVVVTEHADEPPLDISLALGIGGEESWVLIRSLQIHDKDAQPIINWLFPAGVETLIILPTEAVDDLNIDLADELRDLGSGELVEAFQRLVDAQSETGATIRNRRDGTIVLTMPIDNAEALVELIRATADNDEIEISIEEAEAELDDDELGLLGSTMEFVYDPEAELIRSFAITGFGAADGTLSVIISGDDMDTTLLDPKRVTTPNTRTLDFGMLESLVESIEK